MPEFYIPPVRSHQASDLTEDQMRQLVELIEQHRPKNPASTGHPCAWKSLLREAGIDPINDGKVSKLYRDAGWQFINDPRDNVTELVIKP